MSPNARSLLSLLEWRKSQQAVIESRIEIGMDTREEQRLLTWQTLAAIRYAEALITGEQIPFQSPRGLAPGPWDTRRYRK